MKFIEFIYWLNGWVEITKTKTIHRNEALIISEHIEKIITTEKSEKVILNLLDIQLKNYIKLYRGLEDRESIDGTFYEEQSIDVCNFIKNIIDQYLIHIPNNDNIKITYQDPVKITFSPVPGFKYEGDTGGFGNKKIC